MVPVGLTEIHTFVTGHKLDAGTVYGLDKTQCVEYGPPNTTTFIFLEKNNYKISLNHLVVLRKQRVWDRRFVSVTC